MQRSPLALADVHLDLLYERDEHGLLLRSRDRAVSAPLLHLVRTTEGNRWLLSGALLEPQHAQLQEALVSEPVIEDLGQVESRPPILSGIRSLLATHRVSLKEERGPAFLFAETLPPAMGSGELLREPRDVRTVPELTWIREVEPAQHPLAVVRNSSGDVVAVCHSARATAEAAEAGVETARDYRGRGFAGAVVVCWAAAVRAEGRLPLYSTQWTNHASRAVARKLGVILYGEDYQIG